MFIISQNKSYPFTNVHTSLILMTVDSLIFIIHLS